MKTIRFVTILLLVSAIAITAAIAAKQMMPKQVKVQGQMVCMWCDCVAGCAADMWAANMPEAGMAEDMMKAPHKCMGALRANDGKIYTILPSEVGKQLLDINMHEQKVEVQGCVMPKSQILVPMSYKVTEKVTPVTPEKAENWFYF